MPDWRDANRANWDARVPLHLDTPEYDLAALRAGEGRLHPIEEAMLGPLDGLTVVHLQCHFGRDTLVFAQRGAKVTGVDFSAPALTAAREIAEELGLSKTARFVEADVYDAVSATQLGGQADLVFASWGTIGWLPDLDRWAAAIAGLLRPGGRFVFADGHPAPLVLDDETPEADGRPGWFLPYFYEGVFIDTQPQDYVGAMERLDHPTHEWMHTVSDIVTALLGAGLQITALGEHDAVPWPMFKMLRQDSDGMFRWPDKAWFPLALTIEAVNPG